MRRRFRVGAQEDRLCSQPAITKLEEDNARDGLWPQYPVHFDRYNIIDAADLQSAGQRLE